MTSQGRGLHRERAPPCLNTPRVHRRQNVYRHEPRFVRSDWLAEANAGDIDIDVEINDDRIVVGQTLRAGQVRGPRDWTGTTAQTMMERARCQVGRRE